MFGQRCEEVRELDLCIFWGVAGWGVEESIPGGNSSCKGACLLDIVNFEHKQPVSRYNSKQCQN